jgi:hypothetical protein
LRQKRIILVYFLLLISNVTIAQIITFDKYYDIETTGRDIFQDKSAYNISGSFTGSSSSIFTLDSIGNHYGTILYEPLKPGISIDIAYSTVKVKGNYFLLGRSMFDTVINNVTETLVNGQIIITDSNLKEKRRIVVALDSIFYGITYQNGISDLENNMLYIGRGPRKIGLKIGTLLISKYTSNGELMFHKIDTSREVYYKTVLPCKDKSGFYMGTGTTYDYYTQFNKHKTKYLLRKYNYDGDTIWTKEYPDSIHASYGVNDVAFRDMVVADVDNLFLVGTNIIMKLDKFGNMLWQRPDLKGSRVIKLKFSDEFIVLNNDLVLKIDNNGKVLWQKSFRKSNFGSAYNFISLAATADGGFVLSLLDDFKMRIIKTDCDGNIENPIKCIPPPYIKNEMNISTTNSPNLLNISWSKLSNYKIQLFNSLGQLIFNNTFYNCKQNDIQTNQYPAGVYIIAALDLNENKFYSNKFLK